MEMNKDHLLILLKPDYLQRIVVPPSSVADLKQAGTVKVLEDSCHRDVCKPTNQQHESYTSFLRFVQDIMEKPKVRMRICIRVFIWHRSVI